MTRPPLPDPLPQGEREKKGVDDPKHSSPLAGEEGARPRQRVGRRGGRRSLLDLAKNNRTKHTDAERKLWSIVRSHRMQGWKFKRQEQLGDFIVDFVCFRARLIVEADGSQHADNPDDLARTAWLEGEGFCVIRFWDNDILLNPDGVATAVLAALPPLLPTASRRAPSSPARGEELRAQTDVLHGSVYAMPTR